MLDRSRESVAEFFDNYAAHALTADEQIHALKLMELQRHTMLMFTSCGWFFDELSGIETVQIIQYASRALQLGQELFGDVLEDEFTSRLELAQSNLPEHRDGKQIYGKFVRPAVVNLEKVGAHYAISSLFEDFAPSSRIYAFEVEREDFQIVREGRARLALGRARITSRITRESATLSFGTLHLGDQNVSGGVREYRGEEAYTALVTEMKKLFVRADIPDLVRAVDRNFGHGMYSLRLLFRDEQRKIVGLIMERALAEAASLYRNFYAQYATLARFHAELSIPLPSRFQMAVDFTLHEDLLAALAADEPNPAQVEALLEQVRQTGIPLDTVTLEFAFRRTVERAAQHFEAGPFDIERLRRFSSVVGVSPALPFSTNLWAAQNIYHRVRQAHQSEAMRDPELDVQTWRAALNVLGSRLGFEGELVHAESLAAAE